MPFENFAIGLAEKMKENGEKKELQASEFDDKNSDNFLQEDQEKQIMEDDKKIKELRKKMHEKKSEIQIECPERQDTVDQAISELKQSFVELGIDDWELPVVRVDFVENKGEPTLGRVNKVSESGVEIVFDKQFSSSESEGLLVEKLKKIGQDYPGMKQTLKHELAHIAMWSVTGLERQPATRLLDEGWASLMETLDSNESTEEVKKTVREGFKNEPEFFNRCLEFNKPITNEENLNAAEYSTGHALLLWINQKFGKEKMIELIQKSPTMARRNSDLPEGEFEPALLYDKIHMTAPEYFQILEDLKVNKISKSDAIKKANEWEGRQFSTALLEATGFKNSDEVRQEFLKWLNE